MDRFSGRDARAWFETAFPDSMIRVAVLRFLAESVAHADNQRHDSWAVIGTSDEVRVVVGAVNVLTISPALLRVLYLEGVAARDLEKLPEVECHRDIAESALIAHCAGCDLVSAIAGKALPMLLQSHLHLVTRAAEMCCSADVAEEHAPGIVDYLNGYLLSFLRQPAGMVTAKH